MNTGRTFDEEGNLPLDRYLNEAYFSTRQWIGYCGQVNALRSIKPDTILEIGVGNGMVSKAAEHLLGTKVTGFDINPNLKPDIVGNILKIEEYIQPDSYDCVLAAEIIEHMPFEHFETCLKNIAYATRKHAVITLPRTGNLFHAVFNLPKMQAFDFLLQVPMPYVPKGHHWEIDTSKATMMRAIIKRLENYFIVVDHHRIAQDPKIHIFILEKKR